MYTVRHIEYLSVLTNDRSNNVRAKHAFPPMETLYQVDNNQTFPSTSRSLINPPQPLPNSLH
jgi:hypothetical protein